MKNQKEIVISLRIAIAVFALAGLSFCAYCVPFLLPMHYWYEYVIYLGCSLPCFFVLALAYDVTSQFASGHFFHERPARDLRWAGWILGVDSLLFIVGNVVILCLDRNFFEFFFFFLSVAGLCLAIFFLALSRYIEEATRLKKENEEII